MQQAKQQRQQNADDQGTTIQAPVLEHEYQLQDVNGQERDRGEFRCRRERARQQAHDPRQSKNVYGETAGL